MDEMDGEKAEEINKRNHLSSSLNPQQQKTGPWTLSIFLFKIID
jgi:hypothetical protein